MPAQSSTSGATKTPTLGIMRGNKPGAAKTTPPGGKAPQLGGTEPSNDVNFDDFPY